MAQPIPIDRACNNCPMGHGKAVAGAGPEELTQVKLIVLGDHSGHYEEDVGVPFVSNDSKRMPRRLKNGQMSIEKPRNAGSLLRLHIGKLNLDPDKDVWLTNAAKCNPGKNKPKETDAKKCVRTWFEDELAILDRHVPHAPILIAGNLAFKAISAIYKDCSFSKETLKSCRRTSGHTLMGHPVFFTYNPASVARSEWGIEDTVMMLNNGRVHVTSKTTLPSLPMSPLWIFEKDLELLDKYLNPEKYEIKDEDIF